MSLECNYVFFKNSLTDPELSKCKQFLDDLISEKVDIHSKEQARPSPEIDFKIHILQHIQIY
jgi:hypothetical protein